MHSACFLLRSFHGCLENHFYPPLVFVRLFYPLSITHHPHFVPEQLFPFFVSLTSFFFLSDESMTQCCTLHELM